MKKFLLMSVIAVLFISGCDLGSLPLNVPITVPFALTSQTNSLEQQKNFCLSQYEGLDETSKLQRITYVQSAFRIDSLSNNNLTGTLRVEVKHNGSLIFFYQIASARLADYKTTPKILDLTSEQIQAINVFFENNKDACLDVQVQVSNISSATPPHYMAGFFDLVLEAEAEI
jgi:hypothetical protein